MRLGLRSKLFLISVVLLGFAGLLAGLLFQAQIRGWLEDRIATELQRSAHTARVLVEQPDSPTAEQLDALADMVGAQAEARITVIANDGAVLGDSNVPFDEIVNLSNHGDRPEVIAALNGDIGRSVRHSDTLDTSMLYVAVPYQGGVLRAATPLSEVDAAMSRIRALVVGAGLTGLFFAIVMSFIASHLLTREFRMVVGRARAVVRRVGGSDQLASEVDVLDMSLTQLEREVERLVGGLSAESNRIGAVLEGMDAGVVAVDEAGRIRTVNSSARGMIDADLLDGMRFSELFDVPDLHEMLEDAEHGELLTTEFQVPNRLQRVVANARRQADGSAVIVFHDVTTLRRLERVRQDFVANVSHELRTPSAVIRANAETLLDGAMHDDTAGPRFLNAIIRNADRLTCIISDLLDLSRIESGQRVFTIEPVSIRNVALRSAESVEHAVVQRAANVEIDIPSGARVMADAGALEQVLVNLIENALKYSGAEANVVVRATPVRSIPAANRMRIEIIDNGPGIAAEHRPRVFERFYRVDAGRSRNLGGTGLGLAIVKHLAAQMAGNVGVEPNEPTGSRFWVELPIAGPMRAASYAMDAMFEPADDGR